jgi:hypothetical protein
MLLESALRAQLDSLLIRLMPKTASIASTRLARLMLQFLALVHHLVLQELFPLIHLLQLLSTGARGAFFNQFKIKALVEVAGPFLQQQMRRLHTLLLLESFINIQSSI